MSLSSAYSGGIEHKAQDVDFLTKVLASLGDRSTLILDLGSGPHCQAAQFLSSRDRRICCLEMDKSALKSAMHVMGSRADGVLADMTQIDRTFRHGIFDLVCCFYSAQHLSQPLDWVKRLVTLTNKNTIAMSVFLDRDADGHPLPQLLKSCYRSFLAPGDLGKALEAEGYRIKSWRRNVVYIESNEFPCEREYVIARGSGFKRAKLLDDAEQPFEMTKARNVNCVLAEGA
eukprot:Skav210563  [mRNA]  locus=scaffold2317:130829:131518:+ [translate_table: standard]